MLYEYLKGNYELGEPIFSGDISIPGLSEENGCDGADVCVTKYVWKRINDSINDTVDSIYIGELVRESKTIQ